MSSVLIIFRREFGAYFSTPVAAVFLIVFLALSAGMTFLVSGFFDRGQADLSRYARCRTFRETTAGLIEC